jgi:hypothetical protein
MSFLFLTIIYFLYIINLNKTEYKMENTNLIEIVFLFIFKIFFRILLVVSGCIMFICIMLFFLVTKPKHIVELYRD